jgi:hypothetical protein
MQLFRRGRLVTERKTGGDERVEQPLTSARQKRFCREFLRTLDPRRAAESVGLQDGFALLHDRTIRKRLERMRGDSSSQILREDAVRRLAELAFGRANDAVALALSDPEKRPDVGGLDLSAVAEFRVTDKGGVEIKFLDRVRALETLCALLGEGPGTEADEFYQALEDAVGTETEGR